MGILARITTKIKGNKGAENLTDGGHTIVKSEVLQPTSADVINPTNPGNWSTIRTAPVVQKPQYFLKDVADALKQLATERTEGARQAKRAYKSLGKIEQADANVHRYHRHYQGEVAAGELTKLKANARLGRKLHTQRPEYVRMSTGLERAETNAQARIDELKAKVRERY